MKFWSVLFTEVGEKRHVCSCFAGRYRGAARYPLRSLAFASHLFFSTLAVAEGGEFCPQMDDTKRAAESYQLEIDQSSLIRALLDLATQTELELFYPHELTEVKGRFELEGFYSVREAICTLMADTDYIGNLTESGVITIALQNKTREEPEMKNPRKGLLAAFVSFFTASGGQVANAQDNQFVLEEVLVTAQKREAVAQDVPMALSALPESFLDSFDIDSVENLRDVIPGLEVVSNSPSSNVIAMRGVVALGGTVAPVGYYLDETPISTFAASAPDIALWDVQRVEVLRGPQGTLFGDGSMAGTIRVISNKPDTEAFDARASVGFGQYEGGGDNTHIKGMINLPVSDTFALRGLVSYLDNGGYIDVPELSASDANDHDVSTVKLAVRWQVSDALMLDLSYMRYDMEQGRNNDQTRPGEYDPINFLPPGFALPLTRPDEREMEYDLYNATINYELEHFTVVSSTSFYDQTGSYFNDLNTFVPGFFFGAPVAPFLPNSSAADVGAQDDVESFTQEIRLVSNGDERLDWTVGVFYKDEERPSQQGFDLRVNLDLALFGAPPGTVVPVADELALSAIVSERESFAVFGEIDYAITDQINLNAGVRYYEDDRETLLDTPGSAVFGSVPEVSTVDGTDDTVTPKLSLSYRPNDSVTLFVSASKGFRSGGINLNNRLRPNEISASYSAEELWTYEIGIKSMPSDWLQANFYIYYNDWEELQLAIVTEDGLLGFTENTGSADATGAELELIALPTDGLTISASLAYVDMEIAETVLAGAGAVEVATKGNTVPFVPQLSANLNASYTRPLSENVLLAASASYTYRDNTFSDAANSANQENGAYNMLNARVGLETGRWGVYAYGRNITGSEDTTLRRQPIGVLTDVIFNTFVPPSEFGVEVNFQF